MDDSHFWLLSKISQKNTGLYPPPIGSGSTRLVNNNQPSSQGGPSGVALECTVECSSYNLCLVSLEQASSAEKPTCNNKLAESANVPPLLVLYSSSSSSRVQLTICVLSLLQSCLTKPEPQNLPILALGGVSFSVLLMSLSVVATFALFPLIRRSLAS